MRSRFINLVALLSLKKCRVVLQLGGTAAVLDLLRIVHPGRASATGELLEKPKAGQSKLWCLSRPELVRCAINALLNLSIEPNNQVWLAKHGLPNLIELVCEPAMQSRRPVQHNLTATTYRMKTTMQRRWRPVTFPAHTLSMTPRGGSILRAAVS